MPTIYVYDVGIYWCVPFIPLFLFRFYNHNSSFVHGGIDGAKEGEAVYGQQDIHQKIMQLNFRDCHAKIRKVDSHETLANGVVVQVSTYCSVVEPSPPPPPPATE